MARRDADETIDMLIRDRSCVESGKFQEQTMKSASRIFRRSTGLEDICAKVNEFVSELGKDRVISISTMVEHASVQKYQGGGLSMDASPIEYIMIVWYWTDEEATISK